jgi:plastocyanin
MNDTSRIIIVIVLLVIAGSALAVWSNNQTANERDVTQTNQEATTTTPTPNATSSANEEAGDDSRAIQNEVVYGNNGFTPSNLSVSVGSTVTFTNKSSRDMWVGSDPHPQHTDYSAFDQRRGGKTYSFTFTESGTYEFHNHLSPSHTGTITVTE